MANGLLGKLVPAAGVYKNLGVAGFTAMTANIRGINTDPINAVTARLAICDPGHADGVAPAVVDYIEPLDFIIPAGGILEETALALSPGEVIVVFNSANTVTWRAHGFDTQ